MTNRTGQDHFYTWDHNNRLTTVRISHGPEANFTYDAQNKRITKEVNGRLTRFAWDSNALLSDTTEDRGTHENVYFPGTFEPLAVIDDSRNLFYFHNDPNGAPLEVTDNQATSSGRRTTTPTAASTISMSTNSTTPSGSRDNTPTANWPCTATAIAITTRSSAPWTPWDWRPGLTFISLVQTCGLGSIH